MWGAPRVWAAGWWWKEEPFFGKKQKKVGYTTPSKTLYWLGGFFSLLHRAHGIGYTPAPPKSFHEKAGMSQVGFVFLVLSSCHASSRSASAAILPSALFYERWFARCQLGVLVSAGAAT